MQWIVHGERALYESEWVNLALVDVEIPDERRFDHHVIRMPRGAAGAVDSPSAAKCCCCGVTASSPTPGAGRYPPARSKNDESPLEAAEREAFEETGWRPGPLQHLTTYHPTNGTSDHTFHIFLAEGATHVGDPTDRSEASRVEWVSLDRVREFIASGEIRDGLSLCGLAVALARNLLD